MRIVYFILLKILELAVIVFVPYWVANFLCYLVGAKLPFVITAWFVGLLILGFTIACGFILLAIAIGLWKLNWKWVDKLELWMSLRKRK